MDRGLQSANFCYSERGWSRGSTISTQKSIHSFQIFFGREGIATSIAKSLTNYLEMITKENWLYMSNLLINVIVSWFGLICYKSKISASIYGTRFSLFQVTNPKNNILTMFELALLLTASFPYVSSHLI